MLNIIYKIYLIAYESQQNGLLSQKNWGLQNYSTGKRDQILKINIYRSFNILHCICRFFNSAKNKKKKRSL